MSYKLWLDDMREAPNDGTWIAAKSSAEACHIVNTLGPPTFIAFDHDLGELVNGVKDQATDFLKWLIDNFYEADIEYSVHSENPNGRDNIKSLMESWKKSKGGVSCVRVKVAGESFAKVP